MQIIKVCPKIHQKRILWLPLYQDKKTTRLNRRNEKSKNKDKKDTEEKRTKEGQNDKESSIL